ncbi:hypothetical protein FH603_1636 [Spirosoma sp. LMG 31447]|uniref:Uncharacterized protein n=1 Tax=Spirosoma utsteinense TaxID=2585773 RepID=A0ABR6W3G3_9BACT|nr:hypothetical protein [Spirosoma utsteinense]
MRHTQSMNQFTEIFIFSKQNCISVDGNLKHLRVGYAGK